MDIKLNKSQTLIYNFIKSHLDDMTFCKAFVCSNRVFSDVLGLSRETVSKSLRYLKRNNLLKTCKTGSITVYLKNDIEEWNERFGDYNLCSMPAMVLLTSAENPKTMKKDTYKYQICSLIVSENENPEIML